MPAQYCDITNSLEIKPFRYYPYETRCYGNRTIVNGLVISGRCGSQSSIKHRGIDSQQPGNLFFGGAVTDCQCPGQVQKVLPAQLM